MSEITNVNINSDFLWDNYGVNADCAGFIYDQTNLFVNETTGEMNVPYYAQVKFMNLLEPSDRVIVVLKCRQCVSKNTIITVDSKDEDIVGCNTIETIYNHWKKTKEKMKIMTLDGGYQGCYDEIEDIWETGIKEVYRHTFSNGQYLDCTKDHQINTLNGFKKAEDLTIEDNIIAPKYSNLSYEILKLVSVKFKANEMTYDLRTKKHHSFIANHIHVHNSGFSTAIVALATFQAYFGLYKEIAIVSASAGQAEKVLDRIKKAFNSMADEFKPNFVRQNLTMLELQNGTKIHSLSSNPDTARGYTGVVYLDEFGVVSEKDSNELWKALYPTITTGGRIVAVSTPKGKKGKFYDLATKSLSELTGKKVLNESVRYRVSVDDVPHIKHARDYGGLFDGLTAEEIQQEYGMMFVDENEDSFYTPDFIAHNLYCKDTVTLKGEQISPPLLTDYSEIFPDELLEKYETDADFKITEDMYIQNNLKISYLNEIYSEFTAGWDIASVNDDSFLAIAGKRIDNPTVKDVILLLDMKKFSTDTIVQSKHVKRLTQIFNLVSAIGDGTGIGRGAMENLINDEEISDIWDKVVVNNKEMKIDLHNDLKNTLSNGELKMRYEETKFYQNIYKQMYNLYLINGILKGKGGKDDFPNVLAYLILANKVGTESGIFFI